MYSLKYTYQTHRHVHGHTHIHIEANDLLVSSKWSLNCCCSSDGQESVFIKVTKPIIHFFCWQKWQLEWDTKVDIKLHCIQPTLGRWRGACRPIRWEETVLARVRIGHSYITHSYILKGEDQPQCVACNSPLTVKHKMLDCVDFDIVRTDHF